MESSNIIAGSNVYICNADKPFLDKEYLEQVQDYELLKKVNDERELYRNMPRFTDKQKDILEIGMRCIYAKDDPCFGYVDSVNRIVCDCVNWSCPKINECNPNYSYSEAKELQASNKDNIAYGEPQKQLQYYIVDLVSDDEKKLYISHPGNYGHNYSATNPVIKDKVEVPEEKEIIIDPITGKKMVIVGYRWVISDNASYESDELVPVYGEYKPILGVVNNNQKEIKQIKKAKRIEKLNPENESGNSGTESIDADEYDNKEEFEQRIRTSIKKTYKLLSLEKVFFGNKKSLIVLSGDCEKAYTSEVLLKNDVAHGFSMGDNVELITIDESEKISSDRTVYISENVLKEGCKEQDIKSWKELSRITKLSEISMPLKDYYSFENDGRTRWCIRNMYGVTHLCLNLRDLEMTGITKDGEYRVQLINNEHTYEIRGSHDEYLGKATDRLIDDLCVLKREDEINSLPDEINDIVIRRKHGDLDILGIGHLRFIEY